MNKFGKFFVFAAVLLVLAIGGCGFDIPTDAGTEAAVDPTTSPAPEGKVWVKIPLSADSARTLTGTNNIAFVDYYEVFFVTRADASPYKPTFDTMGTAVPGEVLAVSVYPNETYSVLLLAGDNKTKTLLASAYQDAFEVKADQVNTLNLELKYIMSEPLKDLSFVGYTPNSGDNASYLPIEGTYYEVVDITITTPGTGYARNERLLLNTGGDLDPVVKVTTVGGSGEIETVSIENPGRLAGASDFTSKTGITGTYVTGASGGTGAEFTITTQNGDVNYIPKDVPWLSYIGGRTSSGTGNNPLVFNVKIKNVANLLVAGGPNGKGDSYFTLENADLRIAAIGKGKAFSPVRKTFSSPSVASDPAENGSNTYLGSMTVNYTLDAATDFPGADEKGYGTLYYRATYRAFGLEVGSGWSIRSGRDLIELDEGSLSTGAAILIRIGNPGKYTSKVDVNIPTG